MFKDPNFLALFSYLAGHVVHFMLTRPLRVPAAIAAKQPLLAQVNALEDQLAPVAEAAVNAAIAKKVGVSLSPDPPKPAPVVKIAPTTDIYGNPLGTQYTFGPDGQPVKVAIPDPAPSVSAVIVP